MDGLEFLQRIMRTDPIPVVVCSSLTGEGSDVGLRAIEYGAAEIITKPKIGTKQFFEESRVRISDAVRSARAAGARRITWPAHRVAPKLTADAVLSPGRGSTPFETTESLVVIGASTGGTEALRVFLQAMPLKAPGMLIVQHMPEHFTRAFAERLDGICDVTVKEAQHRDAVLRGRALIAPGNRHMVLKRNGAQYVVDVVEGPLVNRHRPSVDVLFRSAARYAGRNAMGVILTGMGDDGAAGLLEMHRSGSTTFAQDESSCVVFGMPKEAIDRGAASRVLPLEAMAPAVLSALK